MLNAQQDNSNQSLLKDLFGIYYPSKDCIKNNNCLTETNSFQHHLSDVLEQWNYALSSYSSTFIEQFNQSRGNATLLQHSHTYTKPKQFNLNSDIEHYLCLLYNSKTECNKGIDSDQRKNALNKDILQSSASNNVDYAFQTQLKKINDQSSAGTSSKDKLNQLSQSSHFLSLASKDTIATIPSSPQKDTFHNKTNYRLFKTVKSSIKKTPHKIVFFNVKRNQFLNKKTPSPFVAPLFKLSNTTPQISSVKTFINQFIQHQPHIKEAPIKEIAKQVTKRKQKTPRGSRYRGVSKNGNQWQVLIMVNKNKRYVGSYSNEGEAARAYDKVALQNHGVKARTNFDYLEEEVQKILSEQPLLKLISD